MYKYKVLAFISLLFIIGPLYSQNDVEEKTITLKVLSYNIWNGFEWGKDTLRKSKRTDFGRHAPWGLALPYHGN